MQAIKVLQNPGSTTRFFGSLTDDYLLEVLYSGLDETFYQRITVIKLDNIPVMLNLSSTHVNNRSFMNILQNAQTSPIGNSLFADGSKISRGEITIAQIRLNEINNQVVSEYMQAMNIYEDLYYRYSIFSHRQETMELTEYALPGLDMILDKYKPKFG